MKELTQKDYDQIERILLKFLALSEEQKDIVLKEAENILNEGGAVNVSD